MSRRLQGPPRPRDEMGPDPPDAWTFIRFAAMMLIIAAVIVGIGGILHGFPTLSGPAEPQGADNGGDASGTNGSNEQAVDEGNTDPLFGGDDDSGSPDEEEGNQNASDEQVAVETEQQDGDGFEDG